MKYAAYLLASFIMQLVAWVITPILPLFAKPRFGYIDNANKTASEPPTLAFLVCSDDDRQ